jgi:putative endonuclease
MAHAAPADAKPKADPHKAQAFVYLLRCGDGSLYCGWTTDIPRRLKQHEEGEASRYTRSRLPVALAWSKSVASRAEALREEARIKGLSRSEKLHLVALAPSPARA